MYFYAVKIRSDLLENDVRLVLFSLGVAVGVVVLQIALCIGEVEEGVIAGNNAVNNQPLAIALLPAVDVAAASFNGVASGFALVVLAGSVHISFAGSSVTVNLDENVGHNMVGGDHAAVLLEHHVDELSAGAGGEGGAVVYVAVLCENRVTQLVVDTVECTAVSINLVANFVFVNQFLNFFFVNHG